MDASFSCAAATWGCSASTLRMALATMMRFCGVIFRSIVLMRTSYPYDDDDPTCHDMALPANKRSMRVSNWVFRFLLACFQQFDFDVSF